MTLFAFAPSFCSPPSRHLMVPVTSVDQANVTLVVPAGPVTSGPLLSMTQVSPGIPATPTAATTLFEAASPTRSAQAHPVCVRPARAVPSAEYREHAEHEEKAAAIWVRRGPKYDKALIQNLAGKRRDLDYGHFRAKARGQQQTISAYVASTLR